MKNLSQYWTLEDEEFTVTVVSPFNLLDSEFTERFMEVMNRYDLRNIELKKIEKGASYPEQLPSFAYGDLFYVEAVLGSMPGYERIKQDLASWLKIPDNRIFVSEDGTINTETKVPNVKNAYDMADGVEPDVSLAQQGVGQERVKRLMDYMSAKKEERKKAGVDRDKVFVSNHTALKEFFKKDVGYKKGHYKCKITPKGVIVEKAVTKWPNNVPVANFSGDIQQLVEAYKTRKTVLEEIAYLEGAPDYKYLIEGALEHTFAIIQASEEPPQSQEQPQYNVKQKDENTFEVECCSEMIMINELLKVLKEFDGTIQTLSLNKSENGDSYLSLSIKIGENNNKEGVPTAVYAGY